MLQGQPGFLKAALEKAVGGRWTRGCVQLAILSILLGTLIASQALTGVASVQHNPASGRSVGLPG